jgi:hypothetical protein
MSWALMFIRQRSVRHFGVNAGAIWKAVIRPLGSGARQLPHPNE